jgi:tetratricopeptide (TPR) repeat protein
MVPFILPKIDAEHFTGRLDELHLLESQLLGSGKEKACSIVGLSGGGGIGKSALAVHFATVHKDKFPDGVIGLPVDGKTVYEVAREFARRCGEEIDEEDDRSAATIMQEVFAYRRMLLIFDNADRAELKDLRPGGQNCALIVTTRDRSIPDSFGIGNDRIIDLPSLGRDDARELLRRILGAERVEAEIDAADQIIEITGGLPLALQIAGSMLRGRQRSLSSYVESLKEEKKLQRLQVRGDSDLNVMASLNLSLALLEDSEVDFFACLSVCAKDGFSLQTAMVAGGLADEWEAQDFLDRLYQLSLLNEVSQDRYVFHALVRVYAQERVQELNLWEVAARRHAEFFINLVKSNNVKKQQIAERIVEDFDDILQASQWLRENADSNELQKSAYQFAQKLQRCFFKYSYSKQAVELMAGFQVWAEELGHWEVSAKFKIYHAKYLLLEEQISEAGMILRGAQSSIDQIRNPTRQKRLQAQQLNILAGFLQHQEEFDEAILAFKCQITIEEDLNDKLSLAISLNRLGTLLQKQNRYNEAITAFERQIALGESFDDPRQVSIGLNCLGVLLQKQGKHNKALAAFEHKITIDESLRDQGQMLIGLNRLGRLLQQQDRLEEAITVFERQIMIAKNLNDQNSLAIGLNCLGGLLQQQGDLEGAIRAFQDRITISEELDDQKSLSILLNRLGGLLEQQGDLQGATTAFQRQVAIDEVLKNQFSLAVGLNRLGRLLQEQGKIEEAILSFEHQIKISETIKNPKNLVIGLNCANSNLKCNWF